MRRFTFLVLIGTLFVGASAGCSSVRLTSHIVPTDSMVLHFQSATGTLGVYWYDGIAQCTVDNSSAFAVDESTTIIRLGSSGIEWNVSVVELQRLDGTRSSFSGYVIKDDPSRLATLLVIDDLANASRSRID